MTRSAPLSVGDLVITRLCDGTTGVLYQVTACTPAPRFSSGWSVDCEAVEPPTHRQTYLRLLLSIDASHFRLVEMKTARVA